MMTTIAAATTQSGGGWAGPIALIIPFLLMWAATTGYNRWQAARQGTPSLPPGEKESDTVKPQVTADSDSNDSDLPAGGAVVLQKDQKVEFIAARHGRMPKGKLIAEYIAQFHVSESTAWREVKNYETSRKGGAA